MKASDVDRAVAAVVSHSAALGLDVDEAIVVHDSNRLAIHLAPCDVLARVAPDDSTNRVVAAFETTIAQRFAGPGSVIGTLDPRVEPGVHERDGFAITYWTYYVSRTTEIPPDVYARALLDLHREMRVDDVAVPHFTDRVEEALQIVTDSTASPDLADRDRALLVETLLVLRRSIVHRATHEQPLHGEPHPGNVLDTDDGVRFVDLQTCCRGPVEFDLAHAPDGVGERYPGVDPVQLRDCRRIMRAMVAAWRADRSDEFPDGRTMLDRLIAEIRAEHDAAPLPGRGDIGRG